MSTSQQQTASSHTTNVTLLLATTTTNGGILALHAATISGAKLQFPKTKTGQQTLQLATYADAALFWQRVDFSPTRRALPLLSPALFAASTAAATQFFPRNAAAAKPPLLSPNFCQNHWLGANV